MRGSLPSRSVYCSGSIETAQIFTLTDHYDPSSQLSTKDISVVVMVTHKKDKKVKIETKCKSLGWTHDFKNLRGLSKGRLSELSLCGNLHNVTGTILVMLFLLICLRILLSYTLLLFPWVFQFPSLGKSAK